MINPKYHKVWNKKIHNYKPTEQKLHKSETESQISTDAAILYNLRCLDTIPDKQILSNICVSEIVKRWLR